MDLDHDLTNYFEGHKHCNYFESNKKPLQGGGDIEPISPPAKTTSPKAERNILTETWHLEPNKVRFMDDVGTHRANVGRHIPKQGKLVRAKIGASSSVYQPTSLSRWRSALLRYHKRGSQPSAHCGKKRQSPRNQLVRVRTKVPRKDQALSPSLWIHK